MNEGGHIQISDETLATFDREGVWAGMNALSNERCLLSLRKLSEANPSDPIAVCNAQAELRFWQKTVPSIYPQFTDYVARMATTPPVNPAK